MSHSLIDLVGRYGYVVVALFVFAEGVGLPLPGETALVTAAALAGRGTLSIVGVIAASTIGAILGGSGGYWIGLRGGTALLARHGRLFRLDEEKLARSRRFFDAHGWLAVIGGRFVAFLRIFAGLLAGMAGMPFPRFSIYNAVGGLLWSATFGVVGFVFGKNLPRLVHDLGRVSLIVVLLIALVAALGLGWRWFSANKPSILAGLARLWERVAATRRATSMRARFPRAWSLVVGRFAPGEYLGFHLAVGMVLSLATLGAFAAITEDPVQADPLTVFDLTLATRLHGSVTASDLRIFSTISYLGSPVTMAALFLLVAALVVLRRNWLALFVLCAAFVGGALLDVALKTIVHRTRPPFAAQFLHGNTFSFPSGHAMGSLIGYGMLAYLFFQAAPSRMVRAVVVIATALLTIAISASRLYLGVHYFSDVVAGCAAGIIWLATCITGLELAGRQRPKRTAEGVEAADCDPFALGATEAADPDQATR